MAKTVSKDWGNFESITDAPDRYRLIWRSFGSEKTGKNHFGLTGPGPVAIHCMDILGLEGTVEKFARQKEVHVCKYHFNKNAETTQSDARRIRDQFLEDLEVSKRNARTVQVDETEIWEVFRYAEFGDKSDAPKNYDKLNADYREWIHSFDTCDANLQLIQKVKEKWETVDEVDKNGRKVSKGRPSGRMSPTGFKEAGYVVQANIEHTWTPDEGFVVRIHNCRQNMGLVAGLELKDLDLPTLGQMIYPESGPSDWGA